MTSLTIRAAAWFTSSFSSSTWTSRLIGSCLKTAAASLSIFAFVVSPGGSESASSSSDSATKVVSRTIRVVLVMPEVYAACCPIATLCKTILTGKTNSLFRRVRDVSTSRADNRPPVNYLAVINQLDMTEFSISRPPALSEGAALSAFQIGHRCF